MAGRKKKPQAEPTTELVKFGGAQIRLYPRKNGMIALAWNEGGKAMRTTRKDFESARTWAARKCRELENTSGARWVLPAQADRLAWLDRLAGTGDPSRLLADVEAAIGLLHPMGRPVRLEEAARWFVQSGPAPAGTMTVAAAVSAYVTEYEDHHPKTSSRPLKSLLTNFAAEHGHLDLLEVTTPLLTSHALRGKPAPRTLRNRVAMWITFFRRAEALGWWPDGKRSPAAAMKKPMREDKVPSVFTPDQAAAILPRVAENLPQYLSYLLIAGWLGCRPSECLRLDWADFDWPQQLLHIRPEVAQKTRRERWVPMTPTLCQWLLEISTRATHHSACAGKACRKGAREGLSAWLRKTKVVPAWPADVLRHSFITYRLQVLGSVDRTAEEAGNSPSEIRASYRRPIPPGEGERWFAAVATAMAEEKKKQAAAIK